MVFFGSLSIINLVLIEGTGRFNYNTFIVGSLIYLGILFFNSFRRLKREEEDFFLSNDFLLACSPVLLFFGLSLIFAFKDLKIGDYPIYDGLNLYDLLISLMNLSYYWLIILYIVREYKLRNAK